MYACVPTASVYIYIQLTIEFWVPSSLHLTVREIGYRHIYIWCMQVSVWTEPHWGSKSWGEFPVCHRECGYRKHGLSHWCRTQVGCVSQEREREGRREGGKDGQRTWRLEVMAYNYTNLLKNSVEPLIAYFSYFVKSAIWAAVREQVTLDVFICCFMPHTTSHNPIIRIIMKEWCQFLPS